MNRNQIRKIIEKNLNWAVKEIMQVEMMKIIALFCKEGDKGEYEGF